MEDVSKEAEGVVERFGRRGGVGERLQRRLRGASLTRASLG